MIICTAGTLHAEFPLTIFKVNVNTPCNQFSQHCKRKLVSSIMYLTRSGCEIAETVVIPRERGSRSTHIAVGRDESGVGFCTKTKVSERLIIDKFSEKYTSGLSKNGEWARHSTIRVAMKTQIVGPRND